MGAFDDIDIYEHGVSVDSLLGHLDSVINDLPEPRIDLNPEKPLTFEDLESNKTAESPYPDGGFVNFQNLKPTVYIICDKPGFRADAFFKELSKQYEAQIVYLNNPKIPAVYIPLCFVVDVTSEILSAASQKVLHYIHDLAVDKDAPIFLVGAPEDLTNARYLLPFTGATITEFERPIDVKECIQRVHYILEKRVGDKEKKHILLVDDSITFLRLAQKALEKEYRVTISSSALNAIRALSNPAKPLPDLIIVDYRMPACSGDVFVNMLKLDEHYKSIPIIFYSSNNDVNDMIGLMGSIEGYVLKTDPITKLIQYVKELFEKKEKEALLTGKIVSEKGPNIEYI